MKNFDSKEALFDYLRDVRETMSDVWNPTYERTHTYFFPDYDEEEDEMIMQGVVWQDPQPIDSDNAYHVPASLGLGKPGVLFGLFNISIEDEPCAPVFVWDAFDFDNKPATMCAFGEGNADLLNRDACHVLFTWSFDGEDDEGEMAWRCFPNK